MDTLLRLLNELRERGFRYHILHIHPDAVTVLVHAAEQGTGRLARWEIDFKRMGEPESRVYRSPDQVPEVAELVTLLRSLEPLP
jgi:hypothetical protein